MATFATYINILQLSHAPLSVYSCVLRIKEYILHQPNFVIESDI